MNKRVGGVRGGRSSEAVGACHEGARRPSEAVGAKALSPHAGSNERHKRKAKRSGAKRRVVWLWGCATR